MWIVTANGTFTFTTYNWETGKGKTLMSNKNGSDWVGNLYN